MLTYYMPTRIIADKACIYENKELLRGFGRKALIVTGRRSAKACGALDDVIRSLEAMEMTYTIYDQVMSNPTIACAYEGALLAKEFGAEMVIAIGGGSPIDAAKAMALLAKQDIKEEDLFKGGYSSDILPIIAVPTTAGTGSEATQYAILTNDMLETKSGLATLGIFPKIAFLDATYTMGLPLVVTIHTAIDALSHSVEGMLSVKASVISDTLAKVSIGHIMDVLPTLATALEEKNSGRLTFDVREKLLIASMLGGMVIAQTGTTAVHAMGYALTYHKEIEHGKANGLLLGHYMETLTVAMPRKIQEVLEAMKVNSTDHFNDLMVSLLGDKGELATTEIAFYSEQAMKTGNINNCLVRPTKEDLVGVYEKAFA